MNACDTYCIIDKTTTTATMEKINKNKFKWYENLMEWNWLFGSSFFRKLFILHSDPLVLYLLAIYHYKCF